MKITLDYWEPKDEYITTETGFCYLDRGEVIKHVEDIEGETEVDLFNIFYSKNNTLRYCNGSYYTFQDKKLKEKYKVWLSSLPKNVRFNMYYGNGVVD